MVSSSETDLRPASVFGSENCSRYLGAINVWVIDRRCGRDTNQFFGVITSGRVSAADHLGSAAENIVLTRVLPRADHVSRLQGQALPIPAQPYAIFCIQKLTGQLVTES